MATIIELQHEHYRGYKIINYSPQCFMVYWGGSYQGIWEDRSFRLCKKWIDNRESKIDYNRDCWNQKEAEEAGKEKDENYKKNTTKTII